MQDQLNKAMLHNHLLDIIYIAKNGIITKRRIKIIKMAGDKLHVYCFTKKAKRTFILENVLAIAPVVQKKWGATC